MYEKIKATKNKRLGTASLMATVAVLMSCAALIPERFGLGGATSTYAALGWNGFWRGNNGYYRTNLTDLQVKDFELFEKNIRMLNNALDAFALRSVAEAVGSSSFDFRIDGKIVTEVLKEIGKWKQYEGIRNLAADKNYARKSVELIQKDLRMFVDLQTRLYGILVDISTLLDAPQMKNKDKLKKVRALKGEDSLTSMAMIDKLGLKSIDEKKIEKAKDLVNKAISCFLCGQRLDGFGQSSNGLVSAWSRFMDSENLAGRLSRDVSLVPMVSALQTILELNLRINKFFCSVELLRTSRAFVQCATDYARNLRFSKIDDDIRNIGGLLLKKNFLSVMGGRFPSMLAMPLVLASNYDSREFMGDKGKEAQQSSFGIDPELMSGIKFNNAKFLEEFVKALKDKRSAEDLVSTVGTYTNEVRNRILNRYQSPADRNGGVAVNYNFGRAFADAMSFAGQEPVKALAAIDQARVALFGECIQKLELSQPDANSKAAVRNGANKVMDRFTKNDNHAYLFSKDAANGAYTDAEIKIGDSGLDFVANALALPDTIKYQALARCYLSDMASSTYSDANWGAARENWVDGTGFMRGAYETVQALAKHYKSSQTLLDKLRGIKKEKVSDDTKTVESGSSSSSRVTSVVAMKGNNRLDMSSDIKFVVNPDGRTMAHISGLNLEEGTEVFLFVVDLKYTQEQIKNDKNVKAAAAPKRVFGSAKVRDGCAEIDITEFDQDKKKAFSPLHSGNYELHLHALRPKETNTAFYCKFKFGFDVDKVSKDEALTIEEEEQNIKYFDFSKSHVFKNKDNTVTIVLKGVGKKVDKPTVILFPKDKPADFNKDQYMAEYHSEDDTYWFVSVPLTSGKWQFHVYNGNVDSGNFVGKVVFDTNNVDKNVSVKDLLEGGLVSYVSKGGKKDDSILSSSMVDKSIRIKLPYNFYDSSADTENVSVKIYDADTDRLIDTQNVDLKQITEKRGYDNSEVYELSLSLPKNRSLRVELPAGSSDSSYVSAISDRFNSNQQTNSVLSMNPSGSYFYDKRGFGDGFWNRGLGLNTGFDWF